MPTWIRNSSLTIVLLLLFALCFGGQALSGWMTENEELQLHGKPQMELGEYLTSGGFLEATFENWESEFLQMALFIFLSAHLIRGARRSPRSHPKSATKPKNAGRSA